MYCFTYWNNKNGWHDSMIFTCNASDITTADQLFTLATGLDPKKCNWIGCAVEKVKNS